MIRKLWALARAMDLPVIAAGAVATWGAVYLGKAVVARQNQLNEVDELLRQTSVQLAQMNAQIEAAAQYIARLDAKMNETAVKPKDIPQTSVYLTKDESPSGFEMFATAHGSDGEDFVADDCANCQASGLADGGVYSLDLVRVTAP